MALATKKIDEFTAGSSFEDNDILYVLRNSVSDVSMNAKLAIKAMFDLLEPPGFFKAWGGVSLPTYYLDCDGSSVSKTTYSALWANSHTSMGTFTVTIASPGLATLVAHGRSTGDAVYINTTGALPTGLTADTTYYVIYVGVDTFRLATSLSNALAGIAITTSGSQSGTHTLFYAPWGVASSTNFYLPDFREASPYGIGTRGSGVTAHDAAVLGQFKDDQLQEHFHKMSVNATAADTITTTVGTGSGSTNIVVSNGGANGSAGVAGPTTGSVGGTPRNGTVTRGKVLGVRWLVKY